MTLQREVNIISEEDTDIYHAICNLRQQNTNEKELQIHFKNEDWIKNNKHQRIKIFDLELDIDNIFNNKD